MYVREQATYACDGEAGVRATGSATYTVVAFLRVAFLKALRASG